MDVSFTTSNFLYNGSKAEVVFTDNVAATFASAGSYGATGPDCWVTAASVVPGSSPVTYTTCVANGNNQSDITAINNLAGSSTLTFRVLAVLSASPAISSVKTYLNNGTDAVDQLLSGSGLATITFDTKYATTPISSFAFGEIQIDATAGTFTTISGGTNSDGANDASTHGIAFGFEAGIIMTTTQKITFKLPMLTSSGAADDNLFIIPDSGKSSFIASEANATAFTDLADNSGGTYTVSTPGTNTYAITLAAGSVTALGTITVQF